MKKNMHWDPNQPFEKIHISHRLNKYWNVQTIPYQDYDLLEQLVVKQKAQTSLIIMDQNLKEFEAKSTDKEAIDIRKAILASLHHLYIFAEDLFAEGNKQHRFAHEVTMENIKLRGINDKLIAKISKQNIELAKLKESIQVVYNNEHIKPNQEL